MSRLDVAGVLALDHAVIRLRSAAGVQNPSQFTNPAGNLWVTGLFTKDD